MKAQWCIQEKAKQNKTKRATITMDVLKRRKMLIKIL